MNHSFVQQGVKEQTILPVRSVEAALITPERNQKLELLIHLISNLGQALVICGPMGIGKTTLLDKLRLQKNEVWPIFTIQATSDYSFESIQKQLSQFVNQQYPAYKNHTLSSILSELDKQNQKIVFIIDNAGQLVPGLIQALIQYSAETLCLRIVFSLTHDEIHLKNRSDKAIEDCHFIEIPVLTEKQCGVFLKNLSVQPGSKLPLRLCNDRMVEKVFLETHGVPGKIISELPELSEYNVLKDYQWVGLAFICILVVTSISYLNSEDPEEKTAAEIKKPALFQKTEEFENSNTQALSSKKVEKNRVAVTQTIEENITDIVSMPLGVKGEEQNISAVKIIKKLSSKKESQAQQKLKKSDFFSGVEEGVNTFEENAIEKDEKNSTQIETNLKKQSSSVNIETETTHSVKDFRDKQRDRENITFQQAISKKTSIEKLEKNESSNIKKVIIADKKVDKPKRVEDDVKITKAVSQKTQPGINVVSEKDNSQWVLEQPEKYYTIQLMVLSKRKSVIDFLKKNQNLNDNLKFFQKNRQGQKKYILIYGSFKNIATATKQMSLLPVKYRKSWLRRFRPLQKEIKNN